MALFVLQGELLVSLMPWFVQLLVLLTPSLYASVKILKEINYLKKSCRKACMVKLAFWESPSIRLTQLVTLL